MQSWILIADAARARVFATADRGRTLELQQAIDNPLGRAKTSELVTDDRGRYSAPGGPDQISAMEHTNSPHDVEEQRWAQRLAEYLNSAFARHEYDSLALVAPAKFLGQLRSAIDAQVRKHVVASMPKDLTVIDQRDLHKHLEPVLSRLA